MKKNRETKNEFRKNNSKDAKGHPAYIYMKEGDEYLFLGLTHSPITKGVTNIKLDRNPNPSDLRPAYVRPRSGRAHKSQFGARLKGWYFGKSDKQKISKLKK